VGERQLQNQPGTIDQYPNWRVPLTDPDGRPVMLEDIFIDPRTANLAKIMNGGH
jgi:4-alpha-glucanotransferase